MSNRDLIPLHRAWWARANTRPLVGLFAPVRVPHGGLDLDVPPGEIAARKRANAEALAAVPGDKLHVAAVNFSTGFVPALAGAGFAHDAHTSWALPVTDDVRAVRVRPFDPHAPRFEAYRRRLDALIETWSWETYLPGHADYLGPLDILAGLLGPGKLALALHEAPDAVRVHAAAAATFLRDMHAFELDLHRQAGLDGGVTDVFATWLPGRGLRYSEDFSALVGEAHFRDFFAAPDAAWLAGLDSTFMHTHSAALGCLPAVLEVPNLGAVEISNDPNGPPLEALIAAGRRVQAAGKPLQLSNWEHPLDEAEIARVLDALDPRGLCLTLQARSLEEAHRLYALATGGRP